MTARSKFQEKVDVLDLIISVLRDHEETLSRIIEKFDDVHYGMNTFVEKLNLLDKFLERLEGLKVKNVVEAGENRGPLAKVKCNDWTAFRAASQGALLVTFEVLDEEVVVSSITDLFVFTYSDGILEFMNLIGEDATLWIREVLKGEGFRAASAQSGREESAYEAVINPEILLRWLSSELGVPKDKIINGRILC